MTGYDYDKASIRDRCGVRTRGMGIAFTDRIKCEKEACKPSGDTERQRQDTDGTTVTSDQGPKGARVVECRLEEEGRPCVEPRSREDLLTSAYIIFEWIE